MDFECTSFQCNFHLLLKFKYFNILIFNPNLVLVLKKKLKAKKHLKHLKLIKEN